MLWEALAGLETEDAALRSPGHRTTPRANLAWRTKVAAETWHGDRGPQETRDAMVLRAPPGQASTPGAGQHPQGRRVPPGQASTPRAGEYPRAGEHPRGR